jgi:hypothetical protein
MEAHLCYWAAAVEGVGEERRLWEEEVAAALMR